MKKIYAILNTLVIFAVIFWNYYSNTGAINGVTVGALSDEYANLFTPAGYAFAIWGIIFIGLILLGFNQLKLAFFGGAHSDTILKIGPWLIIANIGNAAWLWFWLTEQTGISVIVMLVILISLLIVVVRLNMEKWDAPIKVIAWVWWPICAYSGWITVATVANIAAWLAKLAWTGGLSEVTWTIIMISIAAIVNLYMIATRNMREFAAVGIWALVAIAARHWDSIPAIQWAAISWATILFIAISIHAFKHRTTLPFLRRTPPDPVV